MPAWQQRFSHSTQRRISIKYDFPLPEWLVYWTGLPRQQNWNINIMSTCALLSIGLMQKWKKKNTHFFPSTTAILLSNTRRTVRNRESGECRLLWNAPSWSGLQTQWTQMKCEMRFDEAVSINHMQRQICTHTNDAHTILLQATTAAATAAVAVTRVPLCVAPTHTFFPLIQNDTP